MQSIPDPWNGLLQRRAKTLGFQFHEIPVVDRAKHFLQVSAPLPKACRMAVLKTWGNAWTTTTRFHETELWPCIFGCCKCEDSLTNYLTCEPFWTLICTSAKSAVEAFFFPPQVRACFEDLSTANCFRCMVGFLTYHALKMDYSGLILEAFALQNFEEVQNRALELTIFFANEHKLNSFEHKT